MLLGLADDGALVAGVALVLGLEELDSEKKRWGGKDIITTTSSHRCVVVLGCFGCRRAHEQTTKPQ